MPRIRGFLALLAAALIMWAGPAQARVRVIHGPTPIARGNARAAGDVTVANEHLAFSLAVETAPPYGVPRGALVDLAPVDHGKVGQDTVVFADFIPNAWSAWPNTIQQVRIVTATPRRAVIETRRDWGAVMIVTRYALDAGDDAVRITTTMTNGGKVALTGLRSGLTLWPSAGFLFGVPGLGTAEEAPAAGALADRVVAYDAGWAVALHAPYFDRIGDGGKNMLAEHTLAPGASRTFAGRLQVVAAGDLAPVIGAEIVQRHLASGIVTGVVRDAGGRAVAHPVVVIERHGQTYGWTVGDDAGRYRLALPAGEGYAAYATARGWSQSPAMSFALSRGKQIAHDFAGLQPPGTVHLRVERGDTHAPLDARIAIAEGQRPVVQTLGSRTFFTELDRTGAADLTLAPGDYVLQVGHGQDFLARAVRVPVTVAPGGDMVLTVPIDVLFDPAATGWHAADLHHHADQAEAVTPAPDLARSQLAAGLDVLFVSDHDSVMNHPALRAIAERRGVGFLPGIEISASWGHFNAYPIRPGAHLGIDTGKAGIDEILADARAMGAEVVQVNHPFIPFGYFTSVSRGVAPGGFNPGFDLLEVNANNGYDDDRVVQAAWDEWNAGRHHFLAGGTDVHDVWNDLSGRLRSFARVAPGGDFARALKDGHGYVSYGPMIEPETMFGDTVTAAPGQAFSLGFTVMAADGLKRVTLIGGGKVAKVIDLPAGSIREHVGFALTGGGPGWYALIVEDAAGHRAFSDPVWVKPAS